MRLADKKSILILAAVSLSAGSLYSAQPDNGPAATIAVDPTVVKGPVSPDLYGLSFQTINHAGDGGLYAELLRNRSFEDSLVPAGCKINQDGQLVSPGGRTSRWPKQKLPGWKTVQNGEAKVSWSLDSSETINHVRKVSLRLDVAKIGTGRAGIENEGYWGIPITRGERYRFILFAKRAAGSQAGLFVSLEGKDGKIYAAKRIDRVGMAWEKCEIQLVPDATDAHARLVISSLAPGVLWLGFSSLFPERTFMDRPNGCRIDLAEMLKALHPKFMRFSGGCAADEFVRSKTASWKDTIGPIWTRPSCWLKWGYRTTNGLGYLEFLELCQDLGAEPVFVVYSHVSVTGEKSESGSPAEKAVVVKDVLDAIEYANGVTTTKWGAKRAADGHPAPFKLKYVEIGDENPGAGYDDRYKILEKAIHHAYPNIKCISDRRVADVSTGLTAWHFYADPDFFAARQNIFAHRDPATPGVFVGGFASIIKCGNGNLRSAVGEAAFLTGLERTPGVVRMAAFSPLFRRMEWPQAWVPDLIGFNGSSAFGIPFYYVQKMFAENRGADVVKIRVDTPERPYISAGGISIDSAGGTAEFRKFEVEGPGGKVLFKPSLKDSFGDFKVRHGEWRADKGILYSLRRGDQTNQLIAAGDAGWEDYTVQFQVKKTGGKGGFGFRFRDDGRLGPGQDYCRIDFGGKDNATMRIEHVVGRTHEVLGRTVPFRLSDNKWANVVIHLKGARIRCLVDGKTFLDVSMPSVPAISSVATVDRKSGDLILKVVNISGTAMPVDVTIAGEDRIEEAGEETVLTSSSPYDENTLANPRKVVPAEQRESGFGNSFVHTFPAYSVTVLRLHRQ